MRRWDEDAGGLHHGGGSSVEVENPHFAVRGGSGSGTDRVGLMGFGTVPPRSEDGFSSVGGGPLHLNHRHHNERNNSFASPSPSPSRTPGAKSRWSASTAGTITRGGPDPDPSTPLFGSPPGTASKAYRSGPMYASTQAALRESRARDRRRFMGRLAVKATRPSALFLLAGLAFVLTAASWRAAAGAGAAELAGDAAAEIISQAAFGAASSGGAEGITIAQPASLQAKGGVEAPMKGREVVGQHEIAPKMTAAASEQQHQLVAEQATQTDQQHQQQKLEQPVAGQISQPVAATVLSSTPVDSPAKGDAGVLWLLDQNGNKKVVLVPKDHTKKTNRTRQRQQKQQEAAAQKQGLMQKLGLVKKGKLQQREKAAEQQGAASSAETTSTSVQATTVTDAVATATAADPAKSTDAHTTNVVTYYYDAIPAVTSTGPGEEPPAAAQVAIPEVVYDKFGNSVKLLDLHNGRPSPPLMAGEGSPGPVSGLGSHADDTISSSHATRKTASTSNINNMYSSSPNASSAEPQGTTNQLIIVATVATMALFGGAVVARKMRTRNFLNSCIENESLEDELAYDAAHTTLGAAVGYDTFSSGGDIKWRGDLEKFDV